MIYNSELYLNAINKIASEITISDSRILVTGASGLIGSCLVDALVFANRYYDRHFEIYALGRNINRLHNRFGNANDIHYIIQDITESIRIENLDYIIHAASNADPKSYALYPVETLNNNFIGAKNILEYCKHNKTRALLTSTFEVYGRCSADLYSEDEYGVVNLDLIRSCYPESKRAVEMLFKSYADEYGVNCLIARLCSIYGPTMLENDSKAHAQFLRNALNGENIILKSKGTQKRTYCYVMDAVSGIFVLLSKGNVCEAYNIANERSVATIAEVANTIAKLAGTKVVYDLPDEIESKGFSRPYNCILDTHKIVSLGWQGKYNLEEGLSETITILRDI